MLDLPPLLQKRIACSITAAIKYQVPANILLAIAEKEYGKSGKVNVNKNGTYDIGPIQFNSAYLLEPRKYGITPARVTMKGCYPYDLAAWRLRQNLLYDKGHILTRAANYHSQTLRYNLSYRLDLIQNGYKLTQWLEANFSAEFDGIVDISAKES